MQSFVSLTSTHNRMYLRSQLLCLLSMSVVCVLTLGTNAAPLNNTTILKPVDEANCLTTILTSATDNTGDKNETTRLEERWQWLDEANAKTCVMVLVAKENPLLLTPAASNLFSTEQTCMAACAYRKNAKPPHHCQLTGNKGYGNEKQLRWAWSMSQRDCYQFHYHGNQGNANNFATEEKCLAECKNWKYKPTYFQPKCGEPMLAGVSSLETVEEIRKEINQKLKSEEKIQAIENKETEEKAIEAAQLTETETKHNEVTRFGWSVTNGKCVAYQFAGEHGTGNNFVSKEKCKDECQSFGMYDVCRLPVDEGVVLTSSKIPITVMLERWAYNRKINKCVAFKYKGAYGNQNMFLTKEDCEIVCVLRQPWNSMLVIARQTNSTELINIM